jgi:hypothetical protein
MSSSASLRHHRHPLRAVHSPRVARSRQGGRPPRPDPPLRAPAAAAAAENAPAETKRSSASRAADLAPAIFGCSRQEAEGSPECVDRDARLQPAGGSVAHSVSISGGGGLDETWPCGTARPIKFLAVLFSDLPEQCPTGYIRLRSGD